MRENKEMGKGGERREKGKEEKVEGEWVNKEKGKGEMVMED